MIVLDVITTRLAIIPVVELFKWIWGAHVNSVGVLVSLRLLSTSRCVTTCIYPTISLGFFLFSSKGGLVFVVQGIMPLDLHYRGAVVQLEQMALVHTVRVCMTVDVLVEHMVGAYRGGPGFFGGLCW